MKKFKLKKGDLIKTTSNKEHKLLLKTLKQEGFKIYRTTWVDRYDDCIDGYNLIYFNGKKFESFHKEDLTGMLRNKVKRKFKAKKVIASFRTSYHDCKLTHLFI